MKYFVVEIQNGSAITVAYNDIADAWNKYYTVLAAAAVSGINNHGAYLVDNTGLVMGSRFFGEDENGAE